MKRSIKNIIIISIILVLCGGFFFTAKAAVNSIETTVGQMMNIGGSDMGNPPDMPNGNSNSTNESSDSNSDTNTPPELPSGESSDSNMTPPDMNFDSSSSENGGTPPEMPSGENGSAPSGGPGENSNMGNPPEKPDGEASQTSDSETSDSTTQLSTNTEETNASLDSSEVSVEQMPQTNNEVTTESINVMYYVALGAEAFVAFALIIYMIMSKANALTFAETMKSADKYVILVLATALLTTGTLLITDKVMGNVATSNVSISENTEMGGSPEGQPGGSQGTSTVSYSGATTISEDTELSDTTYTSSSSDENALLVSGNITVTADGIVVNKTGDSDGGDSSNFYGTNSGIIAKDGANLTITNATITTDADGANGVFSYGGSATTSNSSSDGTTVTISDSTITTSGDNAGGIMTTGGGTTYANNLTITTSGTSSAAIRSDRGGGTVVVDGGTYTTNGKGSPAVYSTSDTTVSNAELISNTSEGIVIEGKNSVTINNVTLTDTNDELNGQSTTYKNIFLYQSMSGDADNGTAEFTATDSTITTNVGDSFYVTNTTATITLTNNVIINNDSTGNFLRVQADSWGNTGSNGGDVTLIFINQDGEGSIVIDSISTLDISLTEGSNFTGVINADNSAESIVLTIDASSTLTLTGDTYVTSLVDADTTYSNINFNGYTLYVNGVAIN